MNIKQKLTRKNGSALTLAIILTALFLIISSIIMSQINNQIRSNSKMYKEAQKRYEAEGQIETEISQIYKKTSEFLNRIKMMSETPFDTDNSKDYTEIIEQDVYGKIVKATINVKVTHISGSKYKGIVTSKIIDIKSLENLNFESIVDDYKVTTKLDFKTNSELNLTYEVKEYSKQPLK